MAEANAPKLQVLFGADLTDFEAGIKRILSAVDKLEKGLTSASAKIARFGAASSASSGDVNKLIAALDANTRALKSNDAALDRNTASLDSTKKALFSTQSVLFRNTLALNGYKGAVDKTAAAQDKMAGSVKGLMAGFLSLHLAISQGKAFVNNAIEVQRFEKTLKTATGSQKEFTESMEFLQATAKKYQLNVMALGRNYSQLMTATRGTKLEGAQMKELFEATSIAATALQMSTDDVNATFRAFIQMVSKGNVQAEELRGQLGERLVGAFNMAAKSMGVTTKELNKMLEQGQVLAADLLPKMAQHIRETFSQDAIEGAESLGNKLEYAKGQASLFMGEFAKSTGFLDWLSNVGGALGTIAEKLREINKESGRSSQGEKGAWGEIKEHLGLSWGAFGRALLGNFSSEITVNGQPVGDYIEKVERFQKTMAAAKATSSYKPGWLFPTGTKATPSLGDDTGGGGGGGSKKQLTAFEKLVKEAEKLRDVLEDDALKDVQSGRAISFPDSLIEKWNKLYSVISKVSEATGTNIPGSLRQMDESINKPLQNVIDDASGFIEVWTEPINQIQQEWGALQSWIKSATIDTESLWKNEDLYKVEERFKSLRKRLETILIDTYGSLDNATQAGWGSVLESTKRGAEGIAEATEAIADAGRYNQAIKSFESSLIQQFGTLEEAARNGWGGLIDAIKSGTAELGDVMEGINLQNLANQFEGILEDFAADIFSSFGEIIGNMFSGLNADEPQRKIGEVLGGLLQTLGKALIAYGVTTEEVKIVLKSMNGWAAIAAGVAAIAAGVALKSTAQQASRDASQRFWTGGVVQGPGGVDNVPAWLTPGEMVLNRHQQNWLFRALNGAYGVDGAGSMGLKPEEITVNVVGLLSGNDLTIATERTVRSRKVHRGSLG